MDMIADGKNRLFTRRKGILAMERWFISLIENCGCLYWITVIGCHFMRLDLSSNKVEYLRPKIDKIIDNTVDGMENPAILCAWKEYLFYVTGQGERILQYDLSNNCIKTIEINCSDMKLNLYSFAGVVGEKLIIVPMYHYEFVQINLKDDTYSRIDLLNIKDMTGKFEQYYTQNSFRTDGCLEIYSIPLNKLVQIDLNTLSIKLAESIIYEGAPIRNYVHFNKSIIFLNDSNQIYKYENTNGQLWYDLGKNKNEFLSMCIVGSKLWLLPFYGNKIIEISIDNKNIRIVKDLDGISYTNSKNMGKYFRNCKVGNRIYFSMGSGSEIVYLEENGIFAYKVEWPNEEENCEELKYQKRKIIQEVGMPLTTFLSFICKI